MSTYVPRRDRRRFGKLTPFGLQGRSVVLEILDTAGTEQFSKWALFVQFRDHESLT